tara:strand:+ start:136 stop:1014 length:879 start_codon:yes stop_codon:yes gene_type:complete
MAYIGNKPRSNFTSLLKQDFSNQSGTSLTLSHAVANVNDIALYINNVRQEPTEAYSVNGTTVTLTGSVSNSDDIYVIYLARAIQTTVPPDGSVSTAKLADSSVTNAKIANTTIDLTSKVTNVLPVANGGSGVSTKDAFCYTFLSNGSTMYMDGGNWDTFVNSVTNAHASTPYSNNSFQPDGIGSNFDVATGIFTCSVAGRYYVHTHTTLYYPSSVSSSYIALAYRASSSDSWNYGVSGYSLYYSNDAAWLNGEVSGIFDLAVGNQLCVYGYSLNAGSTSVQMNNHNFMGYMI